LLISRIHILTILLCAPFPAIAQTPQPCPRFQPGTAITAPRDYFSSGGVLNISLTYQTSTDDNGNQLFCFVAPDGSQNPTLHISPGDHLIMNITNQVPEQDGFGMMSSVHNHMHMQAAKKPTAKTTNPAGVCDINQDGSYNVTDVQSEIKEVLGQASPFDDLNADGGVNVVDVELALNAALHKGCSASTAVTASCTSATMTPSSVNVHFHGTNTPSTCHQDEVITTIINSGSTFQYDLVIPANEPPGLYWYHPHVHGISEGALLGGASGAIIVEGLQNINSAVAGLTQQLLIIRDAIVPGDDLPDDAPAKDLSLNYVPVPYPNYPPAQIAMKAGEQQLWRVLNAASDTIMDLQLTYDGQAQNLQIVALDGVPTGSQDGTTLGTSITQNHILIPPAGRVEFLVTGPGASVRSAILSTLSVDTGPGGDLDPARPLAVIQTAAGARTASAVLPKVSAPPPLARFRKLTQVVPSTQRKLYFSELSLDPGDPDASVIFFITVDGQTPRAFDPNFPPAITTQEGAVEDWTIENRSNENHEFHIHQIHFLQVGENGAAITTGQYLDTINVPYWSGTGPYPSVTLRMDFRGVTPGDFVYHCHILAHEDAGMMATIRITPAGQ
jgi:FtsP/CotA-like multicopper oxidase with cupredoxin domain